MGKVHQTLQARHVEFIRRQPVFFVGTAPLDPGGHVNVSPKGYDSFLVLDERTVAYLDLVGSGIETVAHLRENGRIVVMFCAFEGPPFILRLYGAGEVLEPSDPEFAALHARFPEGKGARGIVRMALERVQESCGMGVPLMRFEGHRPQLSTYIQRATPAEIEDYVRRENRASIDGLPGLDEDAAS